MNAPAGWNPDPNDPARLRYWDGERWTEDYAPASPQRSATSNPKHESTGSWKTILWVFVGVVAVVGALLVVGFGDGESERQTTVATTETATQLPPRQAGGCNAFDPTFFADVNAGASPYEIRIATSARSGDALYLVASIYATDGDRVSSVDTWARDIATGEVVSISSSAEDFTSFPRGRDLYPDAFSDPVRQSLEDCALEALLS